MRGSLRLLIVLLAFLLFGAQVARGMHLLEHVQADACGHHVHEQHSDADVDDDCPLCLSDTRLLARSAVTGAFTLAPLSRRLPAPERVGSSRAIEGYLARGPPAEPFAKSTFA